MAANVNGVTLAALFYHHQNSPNDEEGFLFGKVVKKVQDTISDSQITNYQVETTIYITDFQPWSKQFSIYGNSSRIEPGMLATILQGKEKEVIGWYGCRRNSTLRISMRESNLHQSLISTLTPESDENFLFLLSTSTATSNLSTLSYDHAFYKLKNRKFERIAVKVVNLGDTTHTEYKSQSQLSVSNRPDSLQNCLASFRNRFESSSGEMIQVKNIQEMSHCLHKQLLSISCQVRESESNLSSLEKEVQELNQQLNDKLKVEVSQKEPLISIDVQPFCISPELSTPSCLADMNNSKQTVEEKAKDISNTSANPISLDIMSNAYSIKLKELDSQVLDLDKPLSSKASDSNTNTSYTSFDDTWLDISISTKPASTTEGDIETKAHVVKTLPSAQEKTVRTDVKSTGGNKTRASAKSKVTNSSTSNQNETPFSFVESILDEEKKKVVSDNCSNSGQTRGSRSQVVHKDTSVKLNTSSTASLKQREGRRLGSTERRGPKTANATASNVESKLDSQTEAKIAHARTQRAKTRNAQAQSRRSLSREGKQQNVPSEQSKRGKLKTESNSKTNVLTKKDNVKEAKNKEIIEQTSDVNSKGETSENKEEPIVTDEDLYPSSSPVF